MNSPEHPNRPLLGSGAVGMLAGAGLLAAHLGQIGNLSGSVLIIVAAVLILKSMGWMFTRRF